MTTARSSQCDVPASALRQRGTRAAARIRRLRPADIDASAATHLTLGEIRNFLHAYRASLAICCAIPILLASAYVTITPRLYTARAQILLEPRTPIPVMNSSVASDRPLDSPEIESQIALLRSEKIALAVINQLRLGRDGDFSGTSAIRATAANEQEVLAQTHQIISLFGRNLDVRRNGLSYAIDVSFSSRNADLAARITNAVAQAFVDDLLETRAQSIRASSRWLEDRIEHIRRQMNEATLRVQRFRLKRDYRIGEGGIDQAALASVPKLDDGKQETLEELESRAQTTRRMFESYLQAYTESLQTQTYAVANARVISPALRPLSPAWPKTPLILSFALLNGIFLGLGQAILRYHLRVR